MITTALERRNNITSKQPTVNTSNLSSDKLRGTRQSVLSKHQAVSRLKRPRDLKGAGHQTELDEKDIQFDIGNFPKCGEVIIYYYNTKKQKFELVRYASKEFL